MNWDNLQYFLAVARHGSLSAAAKHLGVNHSTVARRLDKLEQQLDNRLFDRLASGYELTSTGEQLLEQTLALENQVLDITRHFRGQETTLAGRIKVSKPSSGILNVAPMLADFLTQYPELQIDLFSSTSHSDLSRLEAEVAIRLTDSPPDNLVGREVGRYPLHVYASREYLAELGSEMNLSNARFVIWREDEVDMGMEQWLQQHLPEARVALRCNSYAEVYEATLAGLGVSLLSPLRLPTDTPLQAIAPKLLKHDIGIWLLTHPDLRSSAKVKVFMTFMQEQILAALDS